jgi:hypothetical protein
MWHSGAAQQATSRGAERAESAQSRHDGLLHTAARRMRLVGCGGCGRDRRGLEATGAVREGGAEYAQKRTAMSNQSRIVRPIPLLCCCCSCCCCPLRRSLSVCAGDPQPLSPRPLSARSTQARDNTPHTHAQGSVASRDKKSGVSGGPLCLSRPACPSTGEDGQSLSPLALRRPQ